MPKTYYEPMHTAEHILNQTMLQMFTKERSFSAHLEKKKSKLDYHFDRDLTEEELNSVEEKVNSIITQNLEIAESFMNRDEAKEKFNLDRLPDNAGEQLRVISVGNYDQCLCIGEHVKNTSEIGRVKIISSSHNEGILRLRFKLERNQ